MLRRTAPSRRARQQLSIPDTTCLIAVLHQGQCTGHVADGEGDIRGKKGSSAHFRLDHDDCNEQPDDEEFSDPGSGTDFHATQVSSATFDDVAIVGRGVDNGVSVAFTIVAVDSSLVPPGLFSITRSDGYTNSGSLIDGGARWSCIGSELTGSFSLQQGGAVDGRSGTRARRGRSDRMGLMRSMTWSWCSWRGDVVA
jgi:hypothetical protein